jgi:ribonuclease R
VGSFFRDRGLPTIYRIHPRKEQEEIDAVAKALDEHGIKVPDKDNLTGRDVGRLIRIARRRPNADALISRIMGLVERAYYEVAQADETAPHWGLAREHYLHFTSPIRRYPDLIVHRWLHDVLSREEAKAALLEREQIAELCDVASHCSVRADVADMVETAIDDLKVCEYMDRYVGELIRARIQRVSPAGIEVFLREHYVTGFIPGRTLEGRKKIEGPVLTVSSRKGTRSFKEGDGIEVTVHHVDFIRLEVVLHVADRRRGH